MKQILSAFLFLILCGASHAYTYKENIELYGTKYFNREIDRLKTPEKVHKFVSDLNTVTWHKNTYRNAVVMLETYIQRYKARNHKATKLDKLFEPILTRWGDERDEAVDIDEYKQRGDTLSTQAIDSERTRVKAISNYHLYIKKYEGENKTLDSSLVQIKIGDLLLEEIKEKANKQLLNAINVKTDPVHWYDLAIDYEKKRNRGSDLGLLYYVNDESRKLSYGLMGIARFYELQKSYSKMIKYYREAYREKDFEAAFKIGDIYFEGKCGKKEDFKMALEYYEKGRDYLKESGFDTVIEKSTLHRLAMLKYKSARTNDDWAQAKNYLMESCLLGASEGAYLVGAIYFSGKGCKKNLKDAHAWLSLAYEMGEIKAASALMAVNKKLSDNSKAKYKEHSNTFVKNKMELINERKAKEQDAIGEEQKKQNEHKRLALGYLKLCREDNSKISLRTLPDEGNSLKSKAISSGDRKRVQYLADACERAIKKTPEYFIANSKYKNAKGFDRDKARANLSYVIRKAKDKLLETDKKFAALYTEKEKLETESKLAILEIFINDRIEKRQAFPEKFIALCKEQKL